MASPNPHLAPYRISTLPPDFYYLPNFLTPAEEVSILQKIPTQRWTQLSHRRLQAHPSTLTKNNTLLAAPLPAWLTTPVMERMRGYGIFENTPHHVPNHVLINEYRPGEGIMPHEDGLAYAPVVATVSLGGSLCLDIVHKPTYSGKDEDGSMEDATTEKGMSDEDTKKKYPIPTRILQEPRSLLITTGAAYKEYMHGIASIEIDEDLRSETIANWGLLGDAKAFEEQGGRNYRQTRTSLTYRDVLKVSSAASRVLGGLGRR